LELLIIAKGLADYRAGKPASAVAWIQRLLPLVPPEAPQHLNAKAFALLAMAQHRLNQIEEAASALAKARAIIVDAPDAEHGQLFDGNWHGWLRARILFREADVLLSAGSKQEQPGTTND
jgi:hypothetical protein